MLNSPKSWEWTIGRVLGGGSAQLRGWSLRPPRGSAGLIAAWHSPRGGPTLSTRFSPRSPPRPSPGSLHYSDEDVTKYNDLIPAESSSLTEKPSEVSDSQVTTRGCPWGWGPWRGWTVLGALPEHRPCPLATTMQVLVRIWEKERRSLSPTPSCFLGSSIPRGFVARSQSEAGTAPSPCVAPSPRAAEDRGREGSGVGDCPAARSLVATAASLPIPQNGTFVSSRRNGQLWPGRSVAAGSSSGKQLRGRPWERCPRDGCWAASEKTRLKPRGRSLGVPMAVAEQEGDQPQGAPLSLPTPAVSFAFAQQMPAPLPLA